MTMLLSPVGSEIDTRGRMSSGCISSVGCIDSQAPVRATYVNLYKWPESDAEFVKSVASGGGAGGGGNDQRRWGPQPAVVDSYSCRQMYLRSYTFTRKESMPERTVRCLGKVKDRAAELPFFHQRRDGCGARVADGFSWKSTTAAGKENSDEKKPKTNKRKKKKKGCVTARKLREASHYALCKIFRHLLSCTTTVDVVDRRQAQ